MRREVMTRAGGLPVLLWALCGAVGMLWADAELERADLAASTCFHFLLVDPTAASPVSSFRSGL